MSAPGMDPTMVPVTLEQVQQALLRAIKVAAENAATAQDMREVDEAGKAAKAFADAYVVLDPAVDGTGVPLGHQLDLEALRQEGEMRKEEARSRQAAPATKRKRVTARRDSGSGTTTYDVIEGGG